MSNQVARNSGQYYGDSPDKDADYSYVGTMAGPWAAPVPVTFLLQRRGRLSQIIVETQQGAIATIPAISSITFSPAIPQIFRPASGVAGVVFLLANFGLPVLFGTGLLTVSDLGVLQAYSFAGAFGVGDLIGVAAGCSVPWPAIV